MIKKSNFIPKYEKILNILLREISSRFRRGDLFYTQRELMKHFEASYATIGHVLKDLKAKDIIDCRVGKGIFIKNIPPPRKLRPTRISVFLNDYQTAQVESTISSLQIQGLINSQKKYACEIVYHIRNKDPQKMLSMFHESASDGILFIEDGLFELIDLAEEYKIPSVVVHPIHQKHNLSIEIDDACGFKIATQELIKKGCSQIMILGFRIFDGHNVNKVDGYQVALKLSGIPYRKELILNLTSYDITERLEQIKEAIIKRKNYDGIIVLQPELLELLESVLRRENVKVPEDVKIAVFGNYGYTLKTPFPVGVIKVPHIEAVEAGVELLIRKSMEHNLISEIKLLRPLFEWNPPNRIF
ncbi:MAG: hypothetical protein A2017_15275 [Lentisphaerae bacterium GWF2_44_16]|nr:MAG: hypothetical protein A2017_15275 [Lentisphaerae bacterium GWF2_44_16]